MLNQFSLFHPIASVVSAAFSGLLLAVYCSCLLQVILVVLICLLSNFLLPFTHSQCPHSVTSDHTTSIPVAQYGCQFSEFQPYRFLLHLVQHPPTPSHATKVLCEFYLSVDNNLYRSKHGISPGLLMSYYLYRSDFVFGLRTSCEQEAPYKFDTVFQHSCSQVLQRLLWFCSMGLPVLSCSQTVHSLNNCCGMLLPLAKHCQFRQFHY